MRSLLPVILSSAFAAGCVSFDQKIQENDGVNAHPAPPPTQVTSEAKTTPGPMVLHRPFLHFSSVIQVRPFGDQKTDRRQILTIESVIGKGPDGQTWGCDLILKGTEALSPSDYEELRKTVPDLGDETETLQGLECVPVNLDLSPLEKEETSPGHTIKPYTPAPTRPEEQTMRQPLVSDGPRLSL